MAGTARSHSRIRSHGGADWLGARARTRDEQQALRELERWDRQAARLLADGERDRALAELLHLTVSHALDRVLPLRPTPPPLRVQVYRYACINGWTTAHAEPNRNDPGDQRGHCPTCGTGPCRLDGRLCRRCRRKRRLPVKVLA